MSLANKTPIIDASWGAGPRGQLSVCGIDHQRVNLSHGTCKRRRTPSLSAQDLVRNSQSSCGVYIRCICCWLFATSTSSQDIPQGTRRSQSPVLMARQACPRTGSSTTGEMPPRRTYYFCFRFHETESHIPSQVGATSNDPVCCDDNTRDELSHH